MNQILMTNDENGSNKKEIKPVIKFFAIAIIIVAIIIGCIVGYNLYNSKKQNENYAKPELSMAKNGSLLNLEFQGEIGINKIEYYWNNGNHTVYKCNGNKSANLELEVPFGNNKLNVVVFDVEGNKTKFNNIEVVLDEDEDIVKPEISIVIGSGKINVTATDNVELDYLSYQWDGEEEVKISAPEEDKTKIVQDISVQKGTKLLTITAVDKTGNKESVTNNIVGSNGPKITVRIEDNNFVVNVTDEFAISKIEYTLNEKINNVEGIPESSKEFEFRVPLEEGTNYLKINAYENESIMTEYKCKKTR